MDLQRFRFENCFDDALISAFHQNISTEDEDITVATAVARAITNKSALIMGTVLCSSHDGKDIRGIENIRRRSGCGNPFTCQKADYFCQK